MEKLIPVSKKQHDAIAGTVQQVKEAQQALQIAATAILLGQDEDYGPCGIVGARCVDGVYMLVIDVPDIAPKADDTTADAMSA